ncbi:hypothetical protein PAL_GLEAN10014227 [Pteropus alecto]|uniref:Uncharacterized protein n=1 Tax=Pteropus alecto TaxID=9402 RepID=L5JZX7_PTEAL|nr:hypothetical protein PAL_GLEAN10014227 [Pteropus alecto]
MGSGNCLALSLNTLNSMFFSFSAKRGTGNNFLLTLTGRARSWEVLSGCHEEFSKVLESSSSHATMQSTDSHFRDLPLTFFLEVTLLQTSR